MKVLLIYHSCGNIDASEDYMPFYRSLSKNAIKGYVNVSIWGGQTPDSEWEFLTNNSMAFMPYRSIPYQQYITEPSPSLADVLKAQGYTADAIHTWYGTGYRRNVVYPLLGFDSFKSIEDLPDITKSDYIRAYPSDLATFKEIIKEYENRDTSKGFFNFTITMQNHSGYDLPGYTPTITVGNNNEYPRLEQYLSVIKESDSALEYLINYFSNVDKHTIIVFYGDHQPPYLDDAFYTDLDKNTENSYLIPYVIWANYDIPSQIINNISLNYLSILMMDTAGLQLTPYMEFLKNLQNSIPVITGNGYTDIYGNKYDLDETSPYEDLLNDYRILQYNNVFDYKNRVNEVFSIK